MNRLWLLLAGELGLPLEDLVAERERIAGEIARVESEIAKFKDLQPAA